MHVVVTAGHVDHGKSTLVRALTGQDPDRLAEERRRGLSIELGYAWTELPHVGEVAFVDVPGHQRFVTTALAGMGPVPVAMLVVAADDPWMPQAHEHARALDALGVEHGLLVVTRSDLAEPGPALAEARRGLAGLRPAKFEHLVVSGRTGVGLPGLRLALARLLSTVPAPDPLADVRIWVDRRFHVRGTGLVVTGTLSAGTIVSGDRLAVAVPGGEVARVRGVESLGVRREQVSGPARVALDLGGRAPEGIERGIALTTPGTFSLTTEVDVALSGDGTPPDQPVLHVGSVSQQVRLRPLGEGHARLRLTSPLPLRNADRCVLRDPGDRSVWGVRVLDTDPPPLLRRGAAAQRAKDLTAGRVVALAVDRPTPTVPTPPQDSGPADDALLARLREHFAANPFAAPDAEQSTRIGLDDPRAARLARLGHLIRVAPGIVLLPGADDEALRRFAELESPFTTSAARQALGTSRRVALPLLAHLDRTERTVRLADDRRRLRTPS